MTPPPPAPIISYDRPEAMAPTNEKPKTMQGWYETTRGGFQFHESFRQVSANDVEVVEYAIAYCEDLPPGARVIKTPTRRQWRNFVRHCQRLKGDPRGLVLRDNYLLAEWNLCCQQG